MVSGIYCLTNKVNNKKYIGQSKNIFSRWNEHYRTATSNPDRCSLIHKAINKYGIENFNFEILELCETSKLDELEIKYIKLFKEMGNILYNLTDGGDGGMIMCGEENPNAILTNDEVYDIRERYNNHEAKYDVYNLYKNKVTFNGFHCIWCGTSRADIHMDVYTDDNKYYHKRTNIKSKNLFERSNFSEDGVRKIRDLRQSGMCRQEVYEQYKWINLNTFNDIWYCRTFQNIISTLDKQPTKYVRKNQDGINNHMSKFTIEQIINIRLRKHNGEKMKDVYKLYPFVCKESFRKIWNNKTYKGIGIIDESN